MPTITLSDTTFAELKSIAEPFVDTPESLVTKLIHEEVIRRGASPRNNGQNAAASDGAIRLNPDSHESLKFARVLSATLDNHPIHRPKWNKILDNIHIMGAKRLGSFEELKRASGASIRAGRFENDGYRYLPEADISIQGVDSNLAWNHSLRLARHLGVPIKVTFEWRDKDGAAHPGKPGILEWVPSKE